MSSLNQILSGKARTAPHPSEMILDPGPRPVVSPNTAQAFGAIRADERAFVGADLGRAQLGGVVKGMGEKMGQLVVKQMQAVDMRKENEAQNAMMRADGEIAAKLAQEPDELKWKGIAEKHIQSVRNSIGKTPMSPNLKELVDSDLNRWEVHRISGVQGASAKESFRRAGGAIKDKLTLSQARQDEYNHERTLGAAVREGYLTEAGAELERIEFKETGKRLQLAAKAEQFNVAQNLAITRTKALGEEAALKELKSGMLGGNLDASDKERIRGSIQQTARNDFADAQANLLDGMATGKIQTDADIDVAAPKNFRPADRQLLKDKLKKELSESAKLQAAKPEVIRERFGKLLDAVHQFDPETMGREEATNAFVSIGIESLLLPENLRNDITGPLDKKWRGSLELDTSTKSYITEAVQDLYDNGAFGQIVKEVQVTRTDGSQVWEKQADVEGQKKARALHADAMIALGKWINENPNATREEATQAIYGLSGQSMRVDDAARILSGANAATLLGSSPPAGFPSRDIFSSIAGSLGSGFSGGKITSYGYADDPTPDSNSAAGIGAWVPPAEQEKIKRGEASDFKLKPGDLAVSPDVEAAFQRANIRPGDTVTLTYADGTTHTGRWMDRTAKEYKGKALKGRFDLYSPTGKHARDGQPVISFTRS